MNAEALVALLAAILTSVWAFVGVRSSGKAIDEARTALEVSVLLRERAETTETHAEAQPITRARLIHEADQVEFSARLVAAGYAKKASTPTYMRPVLLGLSGLWLWLGSIFVLMRDSPSAEVTAIALVLLGYVFVTSSVIMGQAVKARRHRFVELGRALPPKLPSAHARAWRRAHAERKKLAEIGKSLSD